MFNKVCNKCKETKPLDLFVKHKQCIDGRAGYCKTCDAATVSNLRRATKLKAITYKGGACSRCSGVFHPAVYDFHHVDPLEKEADPGSLMGRKWKVVKEELDKCILLCSNCHRLTHAEEEWK